MGPSVVSLARLLVSECLAAAPDRSERMVFRVDRGVSAVGCSSRNVGVAMGLMAYCLPMVRGLRGAHGTVGSVAGTFTGAECPEAAPDGSERMVFLVGRWVAAGSSRIVGVAIGLVCVASCQCAGVEEGWVHLSCARRFSLSGSGGSLLLFVVSV